MAEETVQQEKQAIKKERFEFIFTINGNIICQRYFRINGFKYKSLNSKELTDTFNYCVNLIKNDLARKSKIFQWNTSPQVFDNKEQMDEWVARPRWKLEVPSYAILRDSEETYVWNGTTMEPYEGYFNRGEYLSSGEPDSPCVLKLAFLDSGREVVSEQWDGNIYPRFVRTNIDLSNLKNKYEGNGIFAPFESALVKLMIEGQPDLIPQIVKELCVCCSYEDERDYTTTLNYGDRKYNLDTYGEWRKYTNGWESKLRKKTDEYFKNLY